MLEGLAAWILRTYVGEYVENLNTEQLSIGVGTVDLHNLPLKKTALQGLDLPLEVKSGFIGHLQLSIPLRRPKSEPWIINIDKLYLVAGPPLHNNEYNEQQEAEREWIRKKRQLDLLESQWQESQQKGQTGGFWSGSWWPSLYSSFSTTIVENLQLVISDVHIRYEDASIDQHTPFACGITIDRLAAQSTNDKWETEEVIQNDHSIKYKLIDLQNFAIYWDSDAPLVGDLPSTKLEVALQRTIDKSSGSIGKHSYILESISASAKLQRNATALPLRDKNPRFVVDVHVERIPLSLAEVQYRMGMKLMGEFERFFRQARYHKWRPKVPVKNNAKLWWQFASTCILHFIQERNRHHTLSFATKRAHDLVVYVKLYTEHLMSNQLESAKKEELERIEQELSFEELAVLRRLAMRKAEKALELVKASTPDVAPVAPSEPTSTASQGWLGGWYSWYWSADGAAPSKTGDATDNTKPPFKIEPPSTKEEEEFLDELSDPSRNQSIFNRDKVFARLNICLDSGSFKLLNSTSSGHSSTPIVEVEFCNATWESEVRPQSSTWEFNMSLGAIHARDRFTKGTLFASLVSPQERKPLAAQKSSNHSSISMLAMSSTALGLNILQEFDEEPVFEMRFEQMPPKSKVAYRFSITTQPLDIVWNPSVIDRVSDFFSNDTLSAQYVNVERQLREAAWLRYEELKNQTKAELKQTLDSMMEGVQIVSTRGSITDGALNKGNVKSWDIQLEVSAPRFFVPENFKDRKSSVVLVDFGHLSFKNSEAMEREKRISEEEDTDVEDDSFVTPMSTPPSEQEDENDAGICSTESAMRLAENLNPEKIKEAMYDKDKWSDVTSHHFGSSDLHVVDRFTIKLTLERRLIFTADPQCPAVLLSGNLPSLTFHVNEYKCHALTKCFNQLIRPSKSPTVPPRDMRAMATSTPLRHPQGPASEFDMNHSMDELYYSMYSSQVTLDDSADILSRKTSEAVLESALESKTKELLVESRQMVVQFTIDRVSCAVHSRARLIAELQVHRVATEYLKRPYDSSVSFKVHGLYLVDAIQCYGPEFDLLVSSSKPSWTGPGSDSFSSPDKGERTLTETVSSAFSAMADFVRPGSKQEKSPASEDSILKGVTLPSLTSVASAFTSMADRVKPGTHQVHSPDDSSFKGGHIPSVSSAFSAMAGMIRPGSRQDRCSSADTIVESPMPSATLDENDLISLEYLQVSKDCPSTEKALRMATLQFNSLFCIANQETLAVLAQFFNVAFPSGVEESPSHRLTSVPEETIPPGVTGPTQADEDQAPLEINASFCSINILLARSIKTNNMKTIRKVADVTVSEVLITCSLVDGLTISGSLGGLRIMDLTPEGSQHRCALTCGTITDPNPKDPYIPDKLPEDDDDEPSDLCAFRFKLIRPSYGGRLPEVIVRPADDSPEEAAEISKHVQVLVEMASAQYTHTQRFLSELMLCGGDYAQAAKDVGETLRQAASNVAMGLVSKKKSLVEELDYLSSSFMATNREPEGHSSRRHSLDEGISGEILLEGEENEDNYTAKPNRRVYMYVSIETPVVHLPRSSSSRDVLVANLGEIKIRNTHMLQTIEEQEDEDVITVDYDIDRVQVDIQDMSLYSITLSPEHLSRISSGHTLSETLLGGSPSKVPKTGIHILHRTGFQLLLDRQSVDEQGFRSGLEQKKPTICVEARVSTPLKLELSTYTYKQLMDTVDNLGGGEDNVKIPPPASEHGSVAGSPPTQSPTLSPSSSSSNLEAYFDKSVTTKVSFAPLEGHHVNSSDHLKPLEPSHAEEPDDPTPIVANVTVPHFSIKLCGELQNVEHEIVDIKFSDFYLNYQNVKPTLTQFEVYLGGLLVQDLFQDPTSDYAYLMSSSNPRGSKNRARSLSAYHSSLSTSCPTISECGLTSDLSSSLPSYLPESPRRIPFRTLSPLRPLKHGQCPSLPAVRSTLDLGMDSGEESAHKRKLNERRKLKENALVTCYVTLVKNDDEEFETKYKSVSHKELDTKYKSVSHKEFETKSVHRRVQVDFNSLDTVINLQTWVLVLEFFGIGVAPPPSQASSPVTPQAPANFGSMDLDDQMPLDTSPDNNKSINTKVDIQVASLTLTVNKSQYPLAKAKVTGLSCYLDMSEGNMAAEGKLTNISLTDMSPHGALYREKFKTCGKEALSFQFFKYGEPDLDLDRPFDMSLVLRMSSVQYVHTKRFQSELVAFCQHYLQLQEVLGRIRAEDAGNAVSWMIGRGSRVLLDIQAGSPVILVPRSAKSSHMLVADLGDLTLKNCFLWEESPGTISHNTGQKRRTLSDASKAKTRHTCLLDCMTIDLVDMDLFTAVREPEVPVSREFTYTPQGVKLLKEKCRLNLQVERNLDWAFSRAVPDFLFSGRLSSVSAGLDYSQYCLILGLLGENFGEELEEFERPSSYLHDPLGPPPESEDVWTTLRMSIVLVNVSLELLPVQLFEHPEQASDAPLPSLARIDFIRSTFEFETFSDWSKTIDLVSSEVIFEDTREMDDADPCVFTEVLMPKRMFNDDGKGVIGTCWTRTTLSCAGCSTMTVRMFNDDGKGVIGTCWTRTTLSCAGCSKMTVRMFNDDGKGVIGTCWTRTTLSCAGCSKMTVRMFKDDGKGVIGTYLQLYHVQDVQGMFKDDGKGVIGTYWTPTPLSCAGCSRMTAQVQKTFELKVNISGTEFVVLESLGTRDTNAVVLKLTAVLAWRPHLQTQKWLSCSIQNLEMFSCIFSCEEDTAQSIIDPTTALIDLNNARRQLGRRTVGLLEITSEPLPSVEITLQSSFNMRISYNDYKLYLSIFDSVMRQLNKAMKTESKAKQEIPDHDFDDALVRRLMELGFEEVDCINALIATSGRLEASATWLLENATPIIPAKQGDGEGWQFAGFEVRAGTVCVCLIDDCGDTDVPLIELSTQGLYFWHDLQATGDGAANCTLTVEYYNRMVSGWEPWIEPWKCQLHWQQQQKTKKTPKRLLVKLDAPDRLDITVTTVLINMINQTLSSWTEDLYGRADSLSSPAPSAATSSTTLVAAGSNSTLVGSRSRDDSFSRSVSVESGGGSPERRPESSTSLVSLGGQHRRRAPFVPYAIRNNTGCLLMFRTITTTPSRVIITNTGLKLAPHDAHGPGYDKMSEWREVAAGEEIPFEFSSREKMRHKDTHDFIVHQIVVQVEGWAPVTPVSVDRVGKFFRQAQPQATDGNPVASDIHPARIVFDVTLEGGARKVVSVQSSLSVLNKTDIPVEVKLQGPTSYQGHVTLPPIQPHKHMCIPLRAVTWQLYARPQGVSVGFCSEPMEWKSVTRTHHTVGYAPQRSSGMRTDQMYRAFSTKKFRYENRPDIPVPLAQINSGMRTDQMYQCREHVNATPPVAERNAGMRIDQMYQCLEHVNATPPVAQRSSGMRTDKMYKAFSTKKFRYENRPDTPVPLAQRNSSMRTDQMYRAFSTKKSRFCAVVRREGFPEDDVMSELVHQPSTFKLVSHPAHTISIVAPVVLINLLPCDLSYQVKSVGVKGDIKAGRSTPIYSADPDKPFDLGFSIENFTYCENLRVTKRGNLAEHPITHVELRDTNRRSLVLNVLVIVRPGGALRISIFAPYWMVNNTGIPLIFRQEGSSHEMAGQFEEHEMARSLTPLLFSFIDRDTPGRCQMRIGNSYHAGTGKPIWCSPFSLDTPREFNRVHARQADGRPDKSNLIDYPEDDEDEDTAKAPRRNPFDFGDTNTPALDFSFGADSKVYDIGIDVRFGRGRFCLTRIVTFATRYQLENKTPHTLAFSQRHFVRDQGEEEEMRGWLLVEQKGALGTATVTRSLDTDPQASELVIQVRLAGGIGVSVVNYVPEELVYGALEQIEVDYVRTPKIETLEANIGRIQVDNQLFNSTLPVLLYPTAAEKGSREEHATQQPTLHISASKEPTRIQNVEIYKGVEVTLRRMTLHVEERLLLKLLQFFGYVQKDDDLATTDEEDDECLYDNQRAAVTSSGPASRRYYFERLQINPMQLKVSVASAGRLSEDLASLKSSLGLILFNLEDATLDLESFIRDHPFESLNSHLDSMSKHYTEVPVKFFQSGTEDRLRTILQAKQSVPYSWDEPTLPPELSLGVVDGSSYARYFMNILGSGERLYYYNPIYIVFTHTFTSTDGNVCGSFHARSAAPDHGPPLDRRELVLDVPQGTAVILRRKEPLKRSQLWRMTGTGLLRHEGSSPLSDPRKPSTSSSGLVLDIDSLAPPTCGKYVRLVLSKPNTRRKHSQTWAFTEDGRMTCGLPGLFVQSRGGISGLRDGVDAVLGPANITKEEQIPLEQCISTCKLRPGSGCMAVKVIADGPTRVLRITDSLLHGEEEEMRGWLLVEQKGALGTATVTRSLDTDPQASELVIQVRLAGGIGVSVVNYVPEELVYGALEQIEVDYVRTPKIETLEANIGRIQVDNQLFNSTLPVLLYPTAAEKGSREEHATQQPTLHISASKEPTRIQNVEIYKGVEVTLRRMTLHVEERLLLKLLQFFGYVQKDDDLATTDEEDDECLYDNQRAAVTSSGPASRRYYFERLQINPMQLKVSVASAGRLSEDLASLKSSLGLILFNLEDATLDLESFIRDHPFESLNSHLDSMSKHYTEELRSQTAAIVGSIDFLGNPMGLLNDVSSGLEGLVKRGNVGGLFLNVAHGVSDSAAKITGSLSDGLWNASMDTKFKESRETMRAERYGSSRDHFMAGMRGLGMGLVGGLTSIVTQPIEGAHNAGLSGFMTGLAKGIVGTVAKPTAGVLDFASGTAAAVRGQATRSSRYFPPKCTRPRRNCFGPNGSIPRYSRTHAEGQEIMLKLNENNFNEKFVLSESVRRDKEERLKAIITTEGVYFVRAKGTPSPEAIVLLVKYCDLYECQPLSGDGRDYIELVMKADNSSVPTPSKNPSKRPRVRCDSGHIANRVAQKINYSKNLYDEVQQTVIPDPKEPVWG
ncbi:predicted protein [Nematostella vectensis]|uniref:UBA domain-containing protein n=1 Tax=Nematostella vectensis TaxID=45351 RepID=A7S4C6_NEMVE|nr:predicted protein [Nematostella vectensis]|eukprot:XP_001633513.1 predicted protein [Nematostella vectensis]